MKLKALASGPAAPLLAALFLFPAEGVPDRRAWNLSLTVRAEGGYQVIVGGERYDGDFALALAWSGTMEEDDDDYSLVQNDVKLLDWRAQETAASPGIGMPKMTVDFIETPDFDHVFVLREKGFLQVVFALSGLSIPAHDTGDKIRLELPRTAANLVPGFAPDYDAHIKSGSNLVRLPVSLISGEALRRDFSWKWDHKQWSLGQEQLVFLSGFHKASVEIRLRPKTAGRSD